MQRLDIPHQLGSNPVAPTFFRKKPFGEDVEGLRRCWDKSYGSMSVFN